jgi:sugar phosphate isomerase/epimerase
MQTAVATVSLPGPLDEKLAAIAAAGFRGVEIFENDLLSFNGTPAEVANRFHRFRRGKRVMMPAGGKRFGM